ncbi:MAG: HNH endonuclease, partial [Loktanella sp.]|nr:HNH endonuclease [Loktanella sp.]
MTIPAEPYNNHRRKHPLPSIAELRERFRYDPETGELFGPHNRAYTGKAYGYIIAPFKTASGTQMLLRAHRVAFAIMTGKHPHQIDHINGRRDDNRWSNLRDCSASQNRYNNRQPGIWRSERNFGTSYRQNGGKRKIVHRAKLCEIWQIRQEARAAGIAGLPYT